MPELFISINRSHYSGNQHLIVSVSLGKAFDCSIFTVLEGGQVSSRDSVGTTETPTPIQSLGIQSPLVFWRQKF